MARAIAALHLAVNLGAGSILLPIARHGGPSQIDAIIGLPIVYWDGGNYPLSLPAGAAFFPARSFQAART